MAIATRCIENRKDIDNVIQDVNNLGEKVNNIDQKYSKIIYGNGNPGLNDKVNDIVVKLDKKIAVDKVIYAFGSTSVLIIVSLLVKLVFFSK